MAKKKLRDLVRMKQENKKVSWITAYDYQTARIAEAVGVDMILVGDSAGNNLLGYKSTIPVTMDEMIMLSGAVRRGAPNTLAVGDMPLGSYQASNSDAIYNALRFIKETEMDCVKCEGGERVAERVKAMNDAGIGVMGHIGYTPQSTNLTGVVQSKLDNFKRLYNDAFALQEAGACAILLEAVPNKPAGYIAQALDIPIYGIGAGREVDGVLAIVNDVIGLGDFKAKFVKNFCNVEEVMKQGIGKYIEAIKQNEFPGDQQLYPIKEENLKEIEQYFESTEKIRKSSL
ncbi:3-methyl-2-oxobutanoate hydroxymethyltransferase [archaeon]|jgi:3-methyl-2-oxobutanoate hydroxymethyltransferase|nr:3-methyl-2-oxobutanoate hydroxymethyltransferase [archaeon]